MTFSIARLVAALAILVVAVGAGAVWLGRSSDGLGGPGATQAPPTTAPITPSPSPSGPTLESYRAARDAICTPLTAQVIPFNTELGKLKPDTAAAELPPIIVALEQITTIGDSEVASLATLSPPSAVAADHDADIIHHRDSIAVLREALTKLRAGKVTEAIAISDATNPLSTVEEAFEAKYALAGCP